MNWGVKMYINLYFFKIYIEKWLTTTKVKLTKRKGEYILDFAYYKIYFYN